MGGTALAEYYLGHRLCDDLDLFTTDPRHVRHAADLLLAATAGWSNVTVDVEGRDALQWRFLATAPEAEGQTRVDISVSETPFSDPNNRVGDVPVASFEDVVIAKILATCDRVTAKDAVDLWAAVVHGGVELVLLAIAALRPPELGGVGPDHRPSQ